MGRGRCGGLWLPLRGIADLKRRGLRQPASIKIKGRRSFETAIEYGTMTMTAREKTQTRPPRGGRATCSSYGHED